MYQAVYKCRLCGEKFQVGKLYTEKSAINKAARLSLIIPFVINEMGYTLHGCQNNCLGLSDFQGFKKVEE